MRQYKVDGSLGTFFNEKEPGEPTPWQYYLGFFSGLELFLCFSQNGTFSGCL
jgi:hypothetical protein